MAPRINRNRAETDLTGLEQPLDAEAPEDGPDDEHAEAPEDDGPAGELGHDVEDDDGIEDEYDDDGALEDAAALDEPPEHYATVPREVSNHPGRLAAVDQLLGADQRIRDDEIAVELVPIDSISRHPENNNVGDKEAIRLSIREFGFFDPVIVQRSTGHIIGGNHSWEVYREQGAERIPVIFYDVDDVTAKRMLLALNRTTRLGHDDEKATFDLLRSLEIEAGTPSVFVGTGWDLDDFESLAAQFEALPVLPPPAEPEQVQAAYNETPEEQAARGEMIGQYGNRGGNVEGLRELILVLPLGDHADMMANLGTLRRRMPGEYTTGALVAAIIAEAAARPDDAEHPESCPCMHCDPDGAEPLDEPMIPRQDGGTDR